MGNKVSAVNGVRSHNFYKPGNAINQIWIGKKFEVVSRLPFGDSDMAQAGWPIGGWPKIPWHQFIIPLKRRSIDGSESPTVPPATDVARQGLFGDVGNWIQSASSQALGSEIKHSFRGLSSWPCLIVGYCLMPVVLSAYCVPIILTYDPPSFDSIGKALFLGPKKDMQRTIPKKRYRLHAYIATFAFLVGVIGSLLEFYISPAIKFDPEDSEPVMASLLDALKIICSLLIVWRFYQSVKAVRYNWANWKNAQKDFGIGDGDCKGLSSEAEP